MGNARIPALLLVAIAAASIASAEWVAQFSPQSASIGPAASALGEAARFNGSFGNYTVILENPAEGVRITLSGEGESREALAGEAGLLVRSGALNSACNPEGIALTRFGNCVFCGGNSGWGSCSPEAGKESFPAENAADGIPEIAALPLMQKTASAADAEMRTGAVESLVAQQEAPDGTGNVAGPAAGADWQLALKVLAVVLAAAIASHLLLQQRQLQIDPQAERLLQNETRAGIMQELSMAEKIPTDLSIRLGKSKATISEHLDALMRAGLVEKLETPGKKFVYYRLSRLGKQVRLRSAA